MMFFLTIWLYRLIDLLSLTLVAYALLSWFPGAYETKLGQLLVQLVEPMIRPFRRLGLQFGGLDFTIFAMIMLLNFLKRLL